VRRLKAKVTVGAAVAVVASAGAMAIASGDGKVETLSGFEEVPALVTAGSGSFQSSINDEAGEVYYGLTFGNLESAVTQAHIHFENATNNGPIVVFLCSNLPNAPAGTQACPPDGGTITGTIRAADVGGGAAAQGLGAGEFDDFVRALRSGSTYVNVHTVDRPAGEIRAQLNDDAHRHP
jgi:hypothetical protein